MEYLENIKHKVGLGSVDYDNVKKQASFFLRDKINSARLLLTDVTNSQLLAEEATNDDEWGPATKTMAAIAESCRRSDEYPRIVQVLHQRLALVGKQYWRQFLKTLTVVEFLLFHGPEKIVMEFSSDRDLIEELTRFNYVSERGVDHGLVVRKKAKQVMKLLSEDEYLKEERDRAQKLTKSIFGSGSYQSSGSGSGASRYSGFGNTPSSASEGLMFDSDTDDYHVGKKFTAFEERILSEKRGNRQDKSRNESGGNSTSDWKAFEDDASTFSPKQNSNNSNWADFSNPTPVMSPKLNGSSSLSGKDDLLDEETSSNSLQTSTSSIPKTSAQGPLVKVPGKESKKSQSTTSGSRRVVSKVKMSDFASTTYSSGEFKLPPPPPPPGGTHAVLSKSKSMPPAQPVVDLLNFDSETTGSAPGSASPNNDALFSFENPSNASKSEQAIIDLLTISTTSTRLTDFDFLNTNVSAGKATVAISPGLTQLAPDLFDLGSKSTLNDTDAFAFLGNQLSTHQTGVAKTKGSQGGIPDFMNLNEEMTFNATVPDTFGTVAQQPQLSSDLDAFGEQVLGGKDFSSSARFSGFEGQTLSEPSSTAATSLPDAVPNLFEPIIPSSAAFGVRDAEKSAAKPSDDFFNLLS